MKRCAGPFSVGAYLREELAGLEKAGLLRSTPPVSDGLLPFCSNDYLGLAATSWSLRGDAGAGASRLISGNRREHESLERAVSEWLGLPASLVFSSGYAANVGLLSAIAGPGDLVVSDALNHASIIDGARLARARIEVVPHLDVGAVAHALRRRSEARAWVVTESYFSMDADTPDLAALRAVCDREGAALLVDEAHALGVLGPRGRGLCAEVGVTPDALVGTFGKALGCSGAFVAGCPELRLWLWNRARSFVFSTAFSPSVAAVAEGAIRHVLANPELAKTVAVRAAALRAGFAEAGLRVLGHGHIVPWWVGDSARALAAARALLAHGIFVQAIRPPSVPIGTARLRFTVSARHTEADVTRVVEAVREVRCVLD